MSLETHHKDIGFEYIGMLAVMEVHFAKKNKTGEVSRGGRCLG